MLPGRGGGANVGDEGPRLSVAGVVTGAFSPAAWLLGRWRVLACREGGEMSALGDFGGEAAGEGASPAGGKPKSPVGVVTRAAHAGSPPFDGVPVDGLGKPGEPEESRTRPRGVTTAERGAASADVCEHRGERSARRSIFALDSCRMTSYCNEWSCTGDTLEVTTGRAAMSGEAAGLLAPVVP